MRIKITSDNDDKSSYQSQFPKDIVLWSQIHTGRIDAVQKYHKDDQTDNIPMYIRILL